MRCWPFGTALRVKTPLRETKESGLRIGPVALPFNGTGRRILRRFRARTNRKTVPFIRWAVQGVTDVARPARSGVISESDGHADPTGYVIAIRRQSSVLPSGSSMHRPG